MPVLKLPWTHKRDRAVQASSFGGDYHQDIKLDSQTEFTGYDHLDDTAPLSRCINKGKPLTHLNAGEEA